MKINRRTNPIGCISLQQALTRRAARRNRQAADRTFTDADFPQVPAGFQTAAPKPERTQNAYCADRAVRYA